MACNMVVLDSPGVCGGYCEDRQWGRQAKGLLPCSQNSTPWPRFSTQAQQSCAHLEVLNHWLGLLHESAEALDNRLFVVVRAATRLAALQQALPHHLFRALHRQHNVAGPDLHAYCGT